MSDVQERLVKVVSDPDTGVVEVELNRGRALNALNQALLGALAEVAASLAGQVGRVRAVVLYGGGPKAFAAGADLAEMAARLEAGGPEAGAQLARAGQQVLNAWEALPMPTLAAVHGFCLGGGLELALACDMIFAAEGASFGLPEVGLGLVPGFGGSVRLPGRIPAGTARQWLLGAGRVSAAEAHRVGLVQEVFTEAALLPEVRARAAALARGASSAHAAAKRLALAATREATRAGLEREASAFAQQLAGPEGKEGVAAFLARRPPNFAPRPPASEN